MAVFEGLDVSFRRTPDRLFRTSPHDEIAPSSVQSYKRRGLKRRHDPAHARCIERNEIRIAVHEADVPPVRTDLRLISSEQCSLPMFGFSRVQHLKAGKMPADTNQSQPVL
jgi:hypothetical protein